MADWAKTSNKTNSSPPEVLPVNPSNSNSLQAVFLVNNRLFLLEICLDNLSSLSNLRAVYLSTSTAAAISSRRKFVRTTTAATATTTTTKTGLFGGSLFGGNSNTNNQQQPQQNAFSQFGSTQLQQQPQQTGLFGSTTTNPLQAQPTLPSGAFGNPGGGAFGNLGGSTLFGSKSQQPQQQQQAYVYLTFFFKFIKC